MAILNTRLGAARIKALLKDKHNLFFIGIGGIHMASLALFARQRGFCVSGSDSKEGERIAQLRENGITVHIGHSAEHLADAQAVVYTLAVSPDNPEYTAAAQLGLPLISRADFLCFLSADFSRRICVAGSHGKSTVTAMLSEIFSDAGRDPCVFSGAMLPRFHSALLAGKGKDCILEACEYRDSFLSLSPTVALLLNADFDHPDYFLDSAAITSSFAAFCALPGESGTLLYNAEDAASCAAAEGSGARKYSFGLTRGDCHAEGLLYEGGLARFRLLMCVVRKGLSQSWGVKPTFRVWDARIERCAVAIT